MNTNFKSRLETILELNKIELETVHDELYRFLIMQCFSKVCDALRKDEAAYEKALVLSREGIPSSQIAGELVQEYCSCVLDEESYSLLGDFLDNFFCKDSVRAVYPQKLRQKLAAEQNYRCAICGEPITEKTAALDHIVPWVYVGDTLENNLQLLCRSCNSKKRTSFTYPLQALLQNGRSPARG